MTLLLVRMGLPNTVAVLALAAVPLIAMVSAGPTNVACPHDRASAIVVALDPAADIVAAESRQILQ